MSVWDVCLWRVLTPWIFQGGVKHERSNSHEEIAKVPNNEDCIMSLLHATFDSSICEVHEH